MLYTVFSHPSTNQAQPRLASEIRRDRARTGWYGRRPVFSCLILIPRNLHFVTHFSILCPFPWPTLAHFWQLTIYSVYHELRVFWYLVLFYLNSTYKSYGICLSLTYFTMCNALKVHLCCCKWQDFISYGWIIFPYVYIPHFLYPFIYQWPLRLLSYLGYCNNAAVNMGMHISFWVTVFIFFRYKYPEAELLNYMVVQFLIFWGTSILFSRVATPVYFPTNSAWGFLSHPCQHFLFCIILIIGILKGVRWSHCGFDLHFPDDMWCWVPFHVPVGHLYILYGKMFVQILYPFLCFRGGSDGKESTHNSGDLGSVPGLGRSLEEGMPPTNILVWRIPMDRGAW